MQAFLLFALGALGGPPTPARSDEEQSALSHGSYDARFEAAEVVFTTRAAVDGPTVEARLRYLSAGRQDAALQTESARLRREGSVASYDRGTLVEIYEQRAEGLKQSFRFDSLPAGAGDLVVRVGVDTELPLAHASADEVLFAAPDGAGIRIAGVVGVDAAGATVSGTMRWLDGRLELALPEEFVERAVLPLEIDPLISSAGLIATFHRSPSAAPAPNVDVAYLPGADRYYVAWTASYPSVFVQGRVLTGSGATAGPVSTFVDLPFGGGGPVFSYDAHVAAVRGGQLFAVAMIGFDICCGDVWLASVDPVGNVLDARPIVTLPVTVRYLDIAGEATENHDDVLVAWADDTPNFSIHMLKADVPTLTVLETIELTPPGSADSGVAMSATGGQAGRYLVAWRRTGSGPFDGDVYGAVVDRDLNVLAAPFPIAASAANELEPGVDGDGTHWVVAFESADDIACRGVSYDPATGEVRLTSERVVEGDPGQQERDPSVAWMGESYLVAFSERTSGNDWDSNVKSLEAFDCLDCEGEFEVFETSSNDQEPQIASRRSAGDSGKAAMLTWVSTEPGPTPQSAAAWQRLFRADDGTLVDLGGQCGPAATTRVTCAHAGGPPVGVRLEGAPPLVPAALFLGVSRLDLACGACVLVPDPVDALVAPTDAHGEAQVAVAVPASLSTVGFTFFAQWAFAAPSPCSPGLSLARAYQITIE